MQPHPSKHQRSRLPPAKGYDSSSMAPSWPTLPKPGETIAGKYRIARLLGQGGMGAVFEAMHLGLSQKIAIKFLRPNLLCDEEAVARFSREARHASKLSSVHATRIFDVDATAAGIPYIVSE